MENKKKPVSVAMRDEVKAMVPRNKFESFSAALERLILSICKKAKK